MSKNNKNNNTNTSTSEETTPETQSNTFEKYSVNIVAKKLNVRSGPSIEHEVVTNNGAKVILKASSKKYQILEEKDGFGRIDKNRWIMLKHTTKT